MLKKCNNFLSDEKIFGKLKKYIPKDLTKLYIRADLVFPFRDSVTPALQNEAPIVLSSKLRFVTSSQSRARW